MFPLPELESERIVALRAAHILDSGPAPDFDAVVAHVRDLLGVPIGLVSLVDTNRQWFKAKCGIAVDGTDRDVAFCGHALLSDEVLVVEDAPLGRALQGQHACHRRSPHPVLRGRTPARRARRRAGHALRDRHGATRDASLGGPCPEQAGAGRHRLDAVGVVQAAETCTLHGDGLVIFEAGDGTPDTLFVCGQISASHDSALGLFDLFQSPIVQAFPSDGVLHRSFELMFTEVAKPGLATQAMIEVLMKQCLIILLRQQLLEGGGSSAILATLKEPRLARAILAVLERPAAPYTVESLAALAGMSRAGFADHFSQVFGQAPMAFVQRVRLRVAARLLTTTDLPVKMIASTIGYASRSAFSRVLEDVYGASPTDFRAFGVQEEGEPRPIAAAPETR